MPSAVPGAHMAGAGGSCFAWKRIGSDDIHEIPPLPHAMPLRLKRCRCATYAVGKVGASSHQMTRGEKQRDNQEKADSAGDSGCTMKRFLLAILRRAKAGQSYVCAVMAGLVPVIQVLPIRRH